MFATWNFFFSNCPTVPVTGVILVKTEMDIINYTFFIMNLSTGWSTCGCTTDSAIVPRLSARIHPSLMFCSFNPRTSQGDGAAVRRSPYCTLHPASGPLLSPLHVCSSEPEPEASLFCLLHQVSLRAPLQPFNSIHQSQPQDSLAHMSLGIYGIA